MIHQWFSHGNKPEVASLNLGLFYHAQQHTCKHIYVLMKWGQQFTVCWRIFKPALASPNPHP